MLALAQLWNLLAGYAGLVSVGQQAYVGLGGYMLFYLTGVWNVNVYLALLLAGPFAGLMSIPVSFAVFRLRGAYFAIGTWVVSEVFSLFASLILVLGAGSGMSLTVPILREISSDRDVRDTMLYLMTLAVSLFVFAHRLPAVALAPWLGVDGNSRFRAGFRKPRRQHLPHKIHYLRSDRRLHRPDRRLDLPAKAADLARGRFSASTIGPSWSSSWS